MASEVFDRLADRYDEWFDSARGAALFAAEVECLRRLMPEDRPGWVEVGVGSGRFAEALKVPEGVDPSLPLLEKAAARGMKTVRAVAEELPYGDGELEGILLVVTLCFLDDPEAALREFARVLRPGGLLLVGFVPADSAWGREYLREGGEGQPFYSVARFYTCSEALDMTGAAGFRFLKAASTLPMGPEQELGEPPVLDGIVPGCGFTAMMFTREPAGPDAGKKPSPVASQ